MWDVKEGISEHQQFPPQKKSVILPFFTLPFLGLCSPYWLEMGGLRLQIWPSLCILMWHKYIFYDFNALWKETGRVSLSHLRYGENVI